MSFAPKYRPLTIIAFLMVIGVYGAPPSGGPPPPTPPPPPGLPIDSSILLLVALAMFLGVYNIRKQIKTSYKK